MRTEFDCTECGQRIVYEREGDCGGTGYATRTDDNGKEGKVCYPCCGKIDRADMIRHSRATLYLSSSDPCYPYKVTNWPDTLSFPALDFKRSPQRGSYGVTVHRVDVWFRGPDGFIWHGVNHGDTGLCRCRRTKRTKL